MEPLKDSDDVLDRSELMSLVELQKFIAEELADTGGHFTNAFSPLTDGLGLESPKHKETKPPVVVGPPLPPVITHVPTRSLLEEFSEDEAFPPPDPMISAPEAVKKAAASVNENLHVAIASPPPPVPVPTLFRRFMASLMDFSFVVGLWVVTALITVKATGRNVVEIASPEVAQSVAMAYVTILFCYLFIGLGLLETTFGMWVWGLRISYGEGHHFLKKTVRVMLSLLFLGTIVPSLLLVFRLKGRNLLDGLSHSRVYRSSM